MKNINPQELKTEWVKALRSGEYEQGREYLRTGTSEYCCLGVLCDVYRKMTGNGEWDNNVFVLNNERNGVELPSEIRHIFDFPDLFELELVKMNDGGGYSFSNIAAHIEATLP